jgi:hypothetical protein
LQWSSVSIATAISYTPCLVSSVTRDGIVKELRIAGQDWPLKRRDWRMVTVDSGGRIADPEGVACQLVDENGHAIEYRDQDDPRHQDSCRHRLGGLS